MILHFQNATQEVRKLKERWSVDHLFDSVASFCFNALYRPSRGEALSVIFKSWFAATKLFTSVKSDALFSYQPPFNILAFVILKPASYILSPRSLHSANVFLIRLTVSILVFSSATTYKSFSAPCLFTIVIPFFDRHRRVRTSPGFWTAAAWVRQGCCPQSVSQHPKAHQEYAICRLLCRFEVGRLVRGDFRGRRFQEIWSFWRFGGWVQPAVATCIFY